MFDIPEGHVLKLHRTLYGLKQSSRKWNDEIDGTLKKLGFRPSDADDCAYIMTVDGRVVATLALFVDDVVSAGKTTTWTTSRRP